MTTSEIIASGDREQIIEHLLMYKRFDGRLGRALHDAIKRIEEIERDGR